MLPSNFYYYSTFILIHVCSGVHCFHAICLAEVAKFCFQRPGLSGVNFWKSGWINNKYKLSPSITNQPNCIYANMKIQRQARGFSRNYAKAASWKYDIVSKIGLINRCILSWRIILPNFIPIRFETTEPWPFLEEVVPTRNDRVKRQWIKLYPDWIWNDRALAFFGRGHPNKKKKHKNKMSGDMESVLRSRN